MNQDSKLRFFAHGRDLLAPTAKRGRRRGETRIEPLENRIAPAVTGSVAVANGQTQVQLTGDGADDTFSFGSNNGNLTHTFPVGPGGFESPEDFDSTQPGVQPVPVGIGTRVTVSGGGGTDKLDFDGLDGPVRLDIGDGNSATGLDGGFSFSEVEQFGGSKGTDDIRVKLDPEHPITVGGGGGDDKIRASGEGKVDIDGGGGNDKIDASNKGEITIRGGEGNDTLTGKGDKLTIEGGSGNDEINVKAGRGATVLVDGGDDDDVIKGGRANATLLGGKGNDSITGGSGSERIEGGEGEDSLIDGGGNDTLLGGAGSDTIRGGAGKNEVAGGVGEDSLSGSKGTLLAEQSDAGILVLTNNKLTISNGIVGESDTLHKISQVLLEGGPGSDKLDATGFDGAVTLRGGLGGDELLGGTQSPKSSAIFEVQGTDVITGSGKRDGLLILGNKFVLLEDNNLFSDGITATHKGIDLARIEDPSPGGVFVDGSKVSAFSIQLHGGPGQDVFRGGSANDLFFGEDGDDVLLPGVGFDKFVGGPGNNVVSGGSTGGVQIIYNGRTGLVQLLDEQGKVQKDAKTSITQVSKFEGSKLNDIFRITAPSKVDFQINGQSGDDVIIGSGPGGLFINAGSGNDVVVSRNSFGFIQLEGGDDKLTIGSKFGMFVDAGPGADDILGGPGDDSFALQDGEVDTVDGGGGKDIVSSQDQNDVLKNIP